MIWFAIASAITLALRASSKSGPVLQGWLETWRKHLRKHVDDDARRSKAEALVGAELERLRDYFERVDLTMHAGYQTFASYDSTLEQLTPFVDELALHFAELEHGLVDSTLDMRALLEPAEWDAIQAEVGKSLDKYWTRRHKQESKKRG